MEKIEWDMVAYRLKRWYWRTIKWPIHRQMWKIKNFRQLRKHPDHKWFYHLPTFVADGIQPEEEYFWCSCWSCGCCVRRIGLCTLYKVSEYNKEWFERDGKPDEQTVFYEVDGVEYALTFHHDNPPYGLKEGLKYIDVDCFMRVNQFPLEDFLHDGIPLNNNFRREWKS